MSLSNYLENALLDHVVGNSVYTAPANLYLKLHIGDPGENGLSNPAANILRKLIDFGTASAGSILATGIPVAEWASIPNAETYTHFSVWDDLSAGNCLGSGTLSNAATMAVGDIFRITALTWTLD